MNRRNYESRAALLNARHLARQQGLSMRKLEAVCGLSHGFLTRALNTDYGITLNTAVRLANVLEVSLDDLVYTPVEDGTPDEQLLQIDMRIAKLQLRKVEIMAKKK